MSGVPYFTVVLRFPMAALGLFGLSAIALVAILVVFHTVNAIATKSIRSHGEAPPVYELDQRIELKAAKWAGFVLSIAVLSWITIAMYSAPVISARAAEQGKLADRVGITRQTVVALEQGKYYPSLELAFRIAETFGVGVEEVFQRQSNSSQSKRSTKAS